MSSLTRREALKSALAFSAGALFVGRAQGLWAATEKKALFDISLAQWSLNKEIRADKLSNLDFIGLAKTEFDISAVEYVTIFFQDKATDKSYLDEMNKRASDHGVTNVLLMVDREGNLGNPDDAERKKAVENHYRWVEAAKYLGCHSIRVNAYSKGSYDEQKKLVVDGLRSLSEFAAKHDINIIVENHGGLSSNGQWLSSVLAEVNLPNCGSLPDFGNFYEYDRYQGTQELMPFAKGVSAKSHDFDENGNETRIDYNKMMKIVLDAGYRGYVGIEYEGRNLPEREGIAKTKKLLERVREELSA